MMESEQPLEKAPSPETAPEDQKPPPVLPPPLPPTSAARTSPVFHGRLHPFTFFFVLWNTIRGFLIPAIILLFFGTNTTLAFFLIFFMAAALVQGGLRYFTFSYRIENGELITRQGILQRTERNIPLARVQDLRLEQGIFHRILNMVDVHVETAGGQGAEAQLSVLSRTEADRLRQAVFAEMPAAKNQAAISEIPVGPEREIIRQLSVRELIVAGLTSNQMASSLVVVFAIWGALQNLLPEDRYMRLLQFISGQLEVWFAQLKDVGWLPFAVGAVALLLLALAISALGSVVLFYGFTLARSGEDLHRVYGLFTRRTSSLPRKRIQLLKIEEGLLRRFFNLAALRADTAGTRIGEGQENTRGRDALLPIVPRQEVAAMLPVFFPDWGQAHPEWQRVSRKAITRGTFKGAVFCLLAATVLFWIQKDWIALWPLAFLPAVYAVNVLNYRHLGYSLTEAFFQTRRGWLSRATHIVPVRNTQSIVLRQNPFDRRHGVASLIVDTAGQAYTGGPPRINNLPQEEARNLARILARKTSQMNYRW